MQASRVAKTPQTDKPGLEEGFDQTARKVLCVIAPIPFSRESRNQFVNQFLVASLVLKA